MAKKPTPSKTTNTLPPSLSQELNKLGSEFSPTGAATTTGAGSASALGIKTADANLPVVFSLPNQTQHLATPKGATTDAQGRTISSYAQAVQAYYTLDPEQLQYFQEQMFNANVITAKDVTGKPNASTYTAWKNFALDAANSGTAFTSLVNMGASTGNYAKLLQGIQSDVASAQRTLAGPKSATVSLTDPNEIKQAVVSAFASIGEAAPSPQFLNQFVAAYHGQESAGVTSELQQEKQNQQSAVGTLQNEEQAVLQGNPNQLQSLETAQGPISVAGKPTPNLDAEAMAQAKASNPGEYYATQSSYLYGILNQMLYGAPSYQNAPTSPSQTAPGGAVTGTPLVGAGTGA